MSSPGDIVESSRDPFDDLVPGAVVEGKYRVERVIGRGGMGVVVRAQHLELREAVALKFLRIANDEAEGDFRARFALEARVCAKLRNEHIARVRDVGVWRGDIPYMVMEYLEGSDLKRVMRGHARIPLERAISITVQICEGLAEAHADGIVHRDLKPQNIFLTTRRDGVELVKVLDFGISKWTSGAEGTSELTKAGMMLGSPKYMSPEQLNGDAVGAHSDVWAIGALLYTMLTGRAPHDYAQVTQTFMAIASGARPTPPSALEPTVPAALDALILRCLTRDKTQRVQDVAELAGEALEAVGSPFAAQIRASIRAVLTKEAPVLDATTATINTGRHPIFSMAPESSSMTPSPMLTSPPSLRSTIPSPARPSHTRRVAGIVSLGLVAFLGTSLLLRASSDPPSAAPAVPVAAAAARTSTQRTLVMDAPTVLIDTPAPHAAEPARPVAMLVRSVRATHKSSDAGATAPPPAPASSPAAPAPARHNDPATASPAGSLDDRQ